MGKYVFQLQQLAPISTQAHFLPKLNLYRKMLFTKVVLEFLYVSSSCKSIYTELSSYYQKVPAILSYMNICLTHLTILALKATTASYTAE